MEKLCYLLWAPDGRAARATSEALLRDVGARLAALPEVHGVTVHVADSTAPAPATRLLAAHVALWVQVHDRRAPAEALLAPLAAEVDAYLVTESTYVRAPAAAGDVPGTLSLLEAPPGADRVAWQDEIGARARAAHERAPLRRFVRNVVARVLTPSAQRYALVVEQGAPPVGVDGARLSLAVREHVLRPGPF